MEIIKDGIKKYTPTEPNEILEFFNQKREDINEQEKTFKNILHGKDSAEARANE